VNLASAFAGVAEGLQHAHDKHVVHRDIKPSNLILDKSGKLRILDFGLARFEGNETLTASGDIIGTLLYMSPEQAQARKTPVDHKTDIYSLGATMYEMLTWKPPFKGKDHQDTLSQILSKEVEPLRRQNRLISKDVETIVLKCLRKNPSDRYGTAEALAQDLQRFVRGNPIEARPQTSWDKVLRRAQQQKGRLIVTGIISFLFVIVLWLGIEYWNKNSRDKINEYNRHVESAAEDIYRSELNYRTVLGKKARIGSRFLLDPRDIQHLAGKEGEIPIERALNVLHKAVDSISNRPEAYYWRARGLLLLGQNKNSLKELEKVFEYDSDFIPAKVLYAELKNERVDWVSLKKKIDQSADKEWAAWNKSWITAHQMMKDKNWDGAVAALELLKNKSGFYLGFDMETKMGQGIAFLKAKKYRKALREFVAACDRWPDFIEPALLCGKTDYLNGHEKDAEDSFSELYREAKSKDEVLIWIIAVYMSVGEYQKGLEWADKIKSERISPSLPAKC